MRLLHAGIRPHGDRAAPGPPAPESGAGHRSDLRKSLPMHRVYEDHRGGARRFRRAMRASGKPTHEPTRLIGGRIPYIEGPLKVTGRAEYTDDVRRPGMLIARLLRSPHAH